MGTRVPKNIETKEMADYPPNGLPASIKALPEWIQLGCGDAEYCCKEKGATFLAGDMPEKCPDLSKHNNFFAECMREHPGMYERLRARPPSSELTLVTASRPVLTIPVTQ